MHVGYHTMHFRYRDLRTGIMQACSACSVQALRRECAWARRCLSKPEHATLLCTLDCVSEGAVPVQAPPRMQRRLQYRCPPSCGGRLQSTATDGSGALPWRRASPSGGCCAWMNCNLEACTQPYMHLSHVLCETTEVGSVVATEFLFPGLLLSLTLASDTGEGGMRG